MKKTTVLIMLISIPLIFVFFIGSVNASTTIASSSPAILSDKSNVIDFTYPRSQAISQVGAETWQASDDGVLIGITVKLCRDAASNDFDFWMQVYEVTALDSAPTEALPDISVPIAQSTNHFNTSELAAYTSLASFEDFTFSFNGSCVLENNHFYVWAIMGYPDVPVTSPTPIYIGMDYYDSSYSGCMVQYSSGIWSVVNNGEHPSDLLFTVLADPAPTPTPTPSPSPSPSPYVHVDAGLDAVPSYYMIILVLFAVVAVLAGIYVGFERDGGNKGVAFLFALVALVIFVVLIVGYLAG